MRGTRTRLADEMRDRFDWTLFVSVSLLAVVGVINLYSATSVAKAGLSDLYVQQVYWLVAGGMMAGIVTAIDSRHFERFGYALYAFSMMLLVLVFILGREVRGSSRWIYIGSFSLQPSEFSKVFLILALAKFLHNDPKPEGRGLKDLLIPTGIALVPMALIALQPDLGTALIHGLIFVSICAMSRIRRGTLVLIGAVLFLLGIGLRAYGLLGYQSRRIEAWLNPEKNILGDNWDPHHARVAIGNGNLWGRGFMKGTQNQFRFLHEQHSDFPFPVFAEDWGFAGSLFLVGLYAFIILWGLRIASSARDRFGAVVAVGATSLVFWHAIFNLGMVTGLLPVVGVTLPLFSYGGSSVLAVMLGIGLLMNVSMRRYGGATL